MATCEAMSMIAIDFGLRNTSSPDSTCFATLTLAVDPQPMVLPSFHEPSCVGKADRPRALSRICGGGWGDDGGSGDEGGSGSGDGGVRQARDGGNAETSSASFSFDCERVPYPKVGKRALDTTIRSGDMDSIVSRNTSVVLVQLPDIRLASTSYLFELRPESRSAERVLQEPLSKGPDRKSDLCGIVNQDCYLTNLHCRHLM